MSRSTELVERVRKGKQDVVTFGRQAWLFYEGAVVAVLSEEVFFSDKGRSPGEMAAINNFHKECAHVRVMDADFDYYVASSAMRGLRPLLGKPPESTPPSEELGQ